MIVLFKQEEKRNCNNGGGMCCDRRPFLILKYTAVFISICISCSHFPEFSAFLWDVI
jgi:hypothetical protein